jgi:hypothetical protein
VGYWEVPKDTLQQQATIHGDGAVVPASEEDGERKEVVREH